MMQSQTYCCVGQGLSMVDVPSEAKLTMSKADHEQALSHMISNRANFLCISAGPFNMSSAAVRGCEPVGCLCLECGLLLHVNCYKLSAGALGPSAGVLVKEVGSKGWCT